MRVSQLATSSASRSTLVAILVGLAALSCNDSAVTSPEAADIAVAKRGPSKASDTGAGQTFLLTAGKWNSRQTKAVEAAGGTVAWSHRATGIGTATSDNPNFLQEVMESGAFNGGAEDVMTQWQEPLRTVELDQSMVTPGDEGFFSLQWNMQAIEAPGAWAAGADGSGATVAVLDGGFYELHPDLVNLDTGCSVSFVPDQAYNTDTGMFWHGTHVAGIVGGADNGFGVIGVAPEARLLGVKVLHDGSGFFSWIIGGILYASDPAAFGNGACERADIINMSLGATFFRRGFRSLVGAMAKAVNYAASKGVLVISAASNDGLDIGQLYDVAVLPAQSGSGLAVAATGPVNFLGGGMNYRRFASYSNWGEDLVTVAAPGGDFTLFPDGPWAFDMVLSTCRGGSTPPTFSFCFAAGTSMATPAAAGVAALIKGENPGISLGALKAKLKNSADDEGKVGKDEFYGHGFVNARRAVE